jgi:prepilin-type N-terminal cleavage/methylation domain-containing protein/prepilin-type processing-associated H-X9-DG protein
MASTPLSAIHHPKSAFTLVELLVVITIIGILVGLLLPAVQAAREAARRMQCQSNLKQIGLAVMNYESQGKSFPPGSCFPPGVLPDNQNGPDRRETWAILTLPFLEQQALYDKFDRTKSPADDSNAPARSVPLAVMLCPTDSYNRQPFMGKQGPGTTTFGDNWSRGNYGANGGLGMPSGSPYAWWVAIGPTYQGWTNPVLRGVMGINCAISFAQMTDGASNTVMLGEIRAGVTAYDSRGVWALGPGSSALWGHGGMYHPNWYQMDDYGPNNVTCPAADNVMNCTQIAAAMGGLQALIQDGIGGCWDSGNNETTARSMHADGVNVCFADGSVHWISDFIQVLPSSPTNMSVWDRLMASGDG